MTGCREGARTIFDIGYGRISMKSLLDRGNFNRIIIRSANYFLKKRRSVEAGKVTSSSKDIMTEGILKVKTSVTY